MILIAVMAVLFVTLMLASALVDHFVVDETAAIDRDLAETRARWAQIGALDYVLSRAMADGGVVIGFTTQANLISQLQTYLGEFPDFVYTDVAGGGSYTIGINGGVADLGVDGQARISLGIDDPGAMVPLVEGLQNVIPSLVADVCIGDVATGLRSSGGACMNNFSLLGNGIPSVLALHMVAP